MCIGSRQLILVPPTDAAKKYADYLKVLFGLLLALALCEFLGGTFISGIMDVIGVLLGWCAIRNPEGYAFQQVLCFEICQFLFGIWSLLRLAFYFGGVTTFGSSPNADWQFYFFIAALFGGPIIYSFTCYFSFQLYKEMKGVVNELMTGLTEGQQFMGGGGYDVQRPAGYSDSNSNINSSSSSNSSVSSGGSIWSHGESHPSRPATTTPSTTSSSGSSSFIGGFTAFSGQGHKLGG